MPTRASPPSTLAIVASPEIYFITSRKHADSFVPGNNYDDLFPYLVEHEIAVYAYDGR